MLRLLVAVCALLASIGTGLSDQPQEIKIGYLREAPSRIRISLIDVPAGNDGLAGAQLAIEDDNTTGRFLNQHYTLIEKLLAEGEDPVTAMNALADQGASFIVTSLDADRLLKVADAGQARGVTLLNASALDERLREQDCRANVIHVAPTRSMLADGLAQYLVWKKWTKWMLLTGSHPNDVLFAEALRHAATRFGAKIVEQREFKDTGGARRTDSGVAEIQRQMPVVTQGAPEHDVLIAADESEVFAGYLPYRTWDARPVAGSAGLVPTTWNAAFDQWGAVQLQNRFTKQFQRPMTAQDMQVWTAVRMIGEAAVRSGSGDSGKMLAYIKSPDFSVAAFKGQKLTVRDWNLQLRQPILLFDGRNTVSVSPQEGFLHQSSALDTLGLDRPETKCKLK
ncbi:ABC transporter substrate-binding protein [Bradyrhizobium erythrophlei]|uniref:Amino acid/amide ABC transporter substrate-binding protein, HAAT family n=1 Tax=Bradyrhizobium erythrophlei TaxID=1437360 RepID=A0A1M5W2A7_9BRAD|nr:ABC transporter substrate-binding protein [Bradyrhizobium erythrophlei]SHH81560.1 amino acid/amide ABC transporter substrate-binding protein, HAAT family [Bradyrhizobium erythrophlei]